MSGGLPISYETSALLYFYVGNVTGFSINSFETGNVLCPTSPPTQHSFIRNYSKPFIRYVKMCFSEKLFVRGCSLSSVFKFPLFVFVFFSSSNLQNYYPKEEFGGIL